MIFGLVIGNGFNENPLKLPKSSRFTVSSLPSFDFSNVAFMSSVLLGDNAGIDDGGGGGGAGLSG